MFSPWPPELLETIRDPPMWDLQPHWREKKVVGRRHVRGEKGERAVFTALSKAKGEH